MGKCRMALHFVFSQSRENHVNQSLGLHLCHSTHIEDVSVNIAEAFIDNGRFKKQKQIKDIIWSGGWDLVEYGCLAQLNASFLPSLIT